MPKNILVSICGLTPQVITETIYALFKQSPPVYIDEIYIITTKDGKSALLSKHPKGPKSEFLKELRSLEKEYNLKNNSKFDNSAEHIIVAKEESLELPDIRTSEDNELFPNLVTNIIREKTSKKENILYCSLAGGRKTMSTYMGFAMSLFGRKNDKLFHVLASSEFEKSRKFFPGKNIKKKHITLSEVPYIRLNKILSDRYDIRNITYSNLLKIIEQELKKLTSNPLIINIERKYIKFKEVKFSLPNLLFSLYAFIAKNMESNPDGVNIRKLISVETAKEILKIYSATYGMTVDDYLENQKSIIKNTNIKWYNTGITKKDIWRYLDKINNRLKEKFQNYKIYSEFRIKRKGTYNNSYYYIEAPPNKLLVD